MPRSPFSERLPVGSRGQPLQFIMKPTRYCNLRCSYCYETAHLGDTRRMSLDAIASFYRSLNDYAVRMDVGQIAFVWHGGEPLIVPLAVYDRIKELQDALLPGIEVVNGVQTNLTVLTDGHLEHLRSRRFFDTISISFDVVGDQRVDRRGRPTTDIVLGNMQRLIDAAVDFSAICVLSRSTLESGARLYGFFEEIGIACRFLPFHDNTSGTGDHAQSLSQAEIVRAMAGIFDRWIGSDAPIVVRPLADLVEAAVHVIVDGPRRIYDKRRDEWTFCVDPDGEFWGISEIEDHRFRYGNAFTTPVGDILASPARVETFLDSDRRIEALCTDCPYLGHCSGYAMADATPGMAETFVREGCHARALLDHILRRLEEAGIADQIRLRAGTEPAIG